MFIGYARIATRAETSSRQLDALKNAGCSQIFTDEGVTGGAKRRPQLDVALAILESGDVLVVSSLDRLGRSLAHLVELVSSLGLREVGFRSLSEDIDTTSELGRDALGIFTALAKFEHALVAERTRLGLVDARNRGAKLGRKPKLSGEQIARAKQMIDSGQSPTQVAKSIGVSPATLYRAIPAGASNRNSEDLFAGLN